MQDVNLRVKRQCYWLIPVMILGLVYQFFAAIGYIYIYITYLNTNTFVSWGIEGFCVFNIYAQTGFEMVHFGWTPVWTAIFSLIFFIVMIYLFIGVMKDATPFTKKTVFLLKGESLIFFLMTVFPVVLRIFAWRITKQVGVFYTDLIYGIPGTAILYGLAKIFEYGSELQKLSDETL